MKNVLHMENTRLNLRSLLGLLPKLGFETDIKISPEHILKKPVFILAIIFIFTEILRIIFSTFLLCIQRRRFPKSKVKFGITNLYVFPLVVAIILATLSSFRSFRQYLNDDSIFKTFPVLSKIFDMFLKDVRGTLTIIYAIATVLFCLSVPFEYLVDATNPHKRLVGKLFVAITALSTAALRITVFTEKEDIPLYMTERISPEASRFFLLSSVLLAIVSILPTLIDFKGRFWYRYIAIVMHITAFSFVIAVGVDSILGGISTTRQLESTFSRGSSIFTTQRISNFDVGPQLSAVTESILAQVVITTMTDLLLSLATIGTSTVLVRLYLVPLKEEKVSE